LLRRREYLLKEFGTAVAANRSRRMRQLCRELAHVNDLLDLMEVQRPVNAQEETVVRPKYLVSSRFLTQCFRELTVDAAEQFFFVTGPEVAGMRVLAQRVEFPHDKRSVVGVTGNIAATHDLLIRLEQHGHRLLAHFHSHPGLGPDSTKPSGTDRHFQQRLEQAGYPTLAAIFSRDGYIRFFRLSDTFSVHIHGMGVEDLGQQTYRLTTLDSSEGR
jgi:hypothetical protein